MPLKKAGGRPRKYTTTEAAKQANLENGHRRYQQLLQAQGPADFIAYEPPHPDIPTDTPPSGLRTSSDIRIPPDVDVQIDIPTNLRPISLLPTQLPLSNDDAEMVEQITQIRIDEQKSNFERVEYEAEISQQLNEMDAATAQILMGMRSANTTSVAEETRAGETSRLSNKEGLVDDSVTTGLQTIEGSNTTGEGEKVYNEELLHSCFSTVASVDEPIVTWDNNSIAASNTSNRPENIVVSQTSSQQRSPSLHSLNRSNSNRSTSRRSTSFPSQKNNLISWVKSLPRQPPADLNNTSSSPIT